MRGFFQYDDGIADNREEQTDCFQLHRGTDAEGTSFRAALSVRDQKKSFRRGMGVRGKGGPFSKRGLPSPAELPYSFFSKGFFNSSACSGFLPSLARRTSMATGSTEMMMIR